MRIIGLVGAAGAGKDTVADHLVAEHGFVKVAFADALREMAAEINPIVGLDMCDDPALYNDVIWSIGYNNAKVLFPEIRRFLQATGVAVRNIDPDFWVKALEKRLTWEHDVVISDVRFANELAFVQGGTLGIPTGQVWNIKGRSYNMGARGNHESETLARELATADVIIDNNGTLEDLYAAVDHHIKY